MESQNDTTKIPQNPPQPPFENASPLPPKENFFKEVVKFTLIALVIVVPIRMFIAQPFIVSGASMDPTFKSNQYLVVDQLTYHISDPARYDVVIFRYPLNPTTFFIKRIIGLPGETLKSVSGKVTVFNKENPKGLPIEDSFVIPAHRTGDSWSVTLGPTEYFVMGDNRAESSDSRMWGPLERKYIVGRPAVRLFPPTSISIMPGKFEK
jgi:signal peptidase I